MRMRMRTKVRKGGARRTGLALGFTHLAGLQLPPAHNAPGLSPSCFSQNLHRAPNQQEAPTGSCRAWLGETPRSGGGGRDRAPGARRRQ